MSLNYTFINGSNIKYYAMYTSPEFFLKEALGILIKLFLVIRQRDNISQSNAQFWDNSNG